MNRLNLFDNFYYDSEDGSVSNYLEKSITNNIKDILQNKATTGLEQLPFNFGIKDISGCHIFEEEVKLRLESYIEERIKIFEPRIVLISARIKQPRTYGYISVEIKGKYKDDDSPKEYTVCFDIKSQ